MCGGEVHVTVDDVERFWQQHLEQQKLQPFDTGVTVIAYVSDGRWVADCVRCRAGVACWPQNPRACCLACGSTYDVMFPDPPVIAAAEIVLAVRPDGAVNWRPDLGEDVDDLKVENLARALPLAPVEEL